MYFILGQAAKRLGIGKATLSRYIKQGRISAQNQSDGSYRIDAAELDRVRDIRRPHVEQSMEHMATSLGPKGCRREIDLLHDMLAYNKIIEHLISERDKWSRMGESLQEDGRSGSR